MPKFGGQIIKLKRQVIGSK